MTAVLLIHGGLWEPMNADRFWVRPGITDSLRRHGFRVIAPDRPVNPPSWRAEVDHVRQHAPQQPFAVIGASNGCPVAAMLADELTDQVTRLVLAWPATAGDPRVDARSAAPRELLDGEILRGLDRDRIARIAVPTAILPSIPENPAHQRRTVDALLRTIPGALELPGTPEPPRPDFRAGRFSDSIVPFLR